MNKVVNIVLCFLATLLLTACFGSKMTSSAGGEVTGVSGRVFSEPTPYGMTLIKRGHLKMGIDKQDSLWGKQTPVKDISIEGFWMDEYNDVCNVFFQTEEYHNSKD